MKHLTINLILGLLLTQSLFAQAPVPHELEEAEAIFQLQLRQIYAPFSNQRIPLRWQYLHGLSQLEGKAKAAGNLDALEAIKREHKRFVAYKDFEKDKRNPLPGPVQAHFDRFKNQDDLLMVEYNALRARAEIAYAKRLTDLQTTLTKANRIPDAVAVKEAAAKIRELKMATRTEPGLANGATPLNVTSPTTVQKHLVRTRWELIWSGGRDNIPTASEFLEFHHGNTLSYHTSDGKIRNYAYEITDDFQVNVLSSRIKHIRFDPSYTLMDYVDEGPGLYRRGRLAGPVSDATSANMLQDILLYYPFDEVAAFAKDAGPLGNHATAKNTAVVHFGKRKNAWQFNGHNANLTVSTPIDVNTLPSFTVACWFQADKLKRRTKIFHWDSDGEYGGVYVSLDEERLTYRIGSGDAKTRYNLEQTVDARKWYHLVLAYDRRGGALLYLNNELAHSVPAPQIKNTATTLYIAGNQHSERDNSFFDGWIDDFFMFKRALSPDEINSLYELGEK